MFIITMPASFDVGQSWPCEINGRAKRLTYHDKDTLIIEARGDQPAHQKAISWIEPAGRVGGVPAVMFWCREPDLERIDLDLKPMWNGDDRDRDLARTYYHSSRLTLVKPPKEG